MTSIATAREHITASLLDRLERLGYEVLRLDLAQPFVPSIGTKWSLTVNSRIREALSIHCRVQRWRFIRLTVHYEIATHDCDS